MRFRSLAVVGLLTGVCGCRGSRFDRIEGEVRSALPVGTAAPEAARILDSLGIKHAALDSLTGTMRALTGPVEKKFVTRADAEFVLHFDSTGHLTTINARKIYTGP